MPGQDWCDATPLRFRNLELTWPISAQITGRVRCGTTQAMLLIDALQFLGQTLYVVLFGVTLGQTLRHPSRATFEIALFFGCAAVVVALALLGAALRVSQAALFTAVSASLLMALPYLLLRLAATFSELRLVYVRAAEIGLVLVVVSL